MASVHLQQGYSTETDVDKWLSISQWSTLTTLIHTVAYWLLLKSYSKCETLKSVLLLVLIYAIKKYTFHITAVLATTPITDVKRQKLIKLTQNCVNCCGTTACQDCQFPLICYGGTTIFIDTQRSQSDSRLLFSLSGRKSHSACHFLYIILTLTFTSISAPDER